MRLLLDTHLLLWVMADDPALSSVARQMITKADTVYASAVSVWEVSIKIGQGKLKIGNRSFSAGLEEAGFAPLDVSWSHAEAVLQLPDIHRDPFDRMLVAQALTEPLRLLTADRLLAGYSELVVVV